jgi:hypothetical protein
MSPSWAIFDSVGVIAPVSGDRGADKAGDREDVNAGAVAVAYSAAEVRRWRARVCVTLGQCGDQS